ncbi:asparagine synthase (glutamine-hydrolyzing) [Thiothrix lacustris]|uniref:asparagine synthase (glutamine-hydrolyzing) n=1 Tax=Thiothrix lacustris TaxID=525917 RepID=A0ABY9MNX4_9GAMM|nr:asparagine synthase (glutamine-hydrolyzing) [Thiothrix lacustris]WML90272.1 asparagine synthase (glutamine-hydrolyzing) [Thiothrix lacustris]
MGGLTGFYSLSNKRNSADMLKNVRRMTASLVHRGADNASIWLDREAGIALGNQTLNPTGHAPHSSHPMTTLAGRYAIALDGEIYNQAALRQRLTLEGHSDWQSTSTIETLLIAFACWGIRRTLQACNGSFAIALWDSKTRSLILIRDRMGEKPLYYGWMKNTFLFGSALKALKMHPAWNATINRDAIANQLRLSYIPTPLTIYHNIYKLEPGHLLQITANSSSSNPITATAWWSLEKQVAQTKQAHFPQHLFWHTHKQTDVLENLLNNIIRRHMHTDATMGSFLSGGVGSSLITALMQKQSRQPLRTFHITYEGIENHKTSQARAIAEYLGTEHSEFHATPMDIQDSIGLLPTLFDEPFSDIEQIPALLMAQLARTNVDVCLSGSGANTLFGGYHRYHYAQQLWQRLTHLPRFLHNTVTITLPYTNTSYSAKMLNVRSPEDIYRHLLSHGKISEDLVLGVNSTQNFLPTTIPKRLSFTERMMYMDALGYLPDNSLTKMDRTSMGIGLETRSPFLDKRMVEFAWQLPVHMKIRHGKGAWLLRQALERHIPRHLSKSLKQPSSPPPLGDWLRTHLRDWAEALLDPSRLRQEGFFDPTPIREKWRQHLSGSHNWQYYLWDLLMFQTWHEHQSPIKRTIAA